MSFVVDRFRVDFVLFNYQWTVLIRKRDSAPPLTDSNGFPIASAALEKLNEPEEARINHGSS